MYTLVNRIGGVEEWGIGKDRIGYVRWTGGGGEEDLGLVVALRPQTPKHIRGGWSHYTDTSEPVDGGVGTLQL
jgi:hypothetical protein